MESTVETTGLMEIDPQAGAQEGDQPAVDPKVKKEDKPVVDETVKELRRALKETRAALKQTTDSYRTLSNERAARTVKEEAPDAEDEEVTTSVDLTEAITAGDHKAVKKALREMGFVDAREVDSRVSKATKQSIASTARDQKLYRDYPDLADNKSEFFQLTSEIYNDLARRDPALKGSQALAEIAAEIAEQRMGDGGGKRKPAASKWRAAADEEIEFESNDDDDDEDEDEGDEERERVERVRRQSGDRGRRPQRSAEPGEESLDAVQKSIVAKLKAAGGDISEDGYKKRALKGVRMSGMPTRRPRY